MLKEILNIMATTVARDIPFKTTEPIVILAELTPIPKITDVRTKFLGSL